MATDNRYVVGLFDDRAAADQVVNELKSARLDGDIDTHHHGRVSGLADRLADHGVPADHARFYAEGVRRGGSLVTVETDKSHFARAVEIMKRHGAVDITRRANFYRSTGYAQHDPNAEPYTTEQATAERENYGKFDYDRYRQDNEIVLPETEEQVQIGKERVEGGGVRIFTRETQVPVEKDVTLHQERVDVDRRKVDRPATKQDMEAFQEGEVTIRETGERPVVSKTQKVTEEVHIGKHAEERTETVKETARKRDVEVERIEGDPDRQTPPRSQQQQQRR